MIYELSLALGPWAGHSHKDYLVILYLDDW